MVFQCFPVITHSSTMHLGRNFSVMVLRDQFADGAPEIPKKLVGCLGTLDNGPGECGKPQTGVVTAPLAEFTQHVVGPILRSHLGTVGEQKSDAGLPHRSRGQPSRSRS